LASLQPEPFNAVPGWNRIPEQAPADLGKIGKTPEETFFSPKKEGREGGT
jgi:hypothetical protein